MRVERLSQVWLVLVLLVPVPFVDLPEGDAQALGELLHLILSPVWIFLKMLIKDALRLLIKALHMLDLHLHPALCRGVHEQLLEDFLEALRSGQILSQALDKLCISHEFVRSFLAGTQNFL